MRCHVVLDKEGRIVSATYSDEPELELHGPERDLKAPEYPILRAGPVAEAGQTVTELGLPEEIVKLPPADFIERLQTDIQAKRPGMKSKK